MTAKSGSQFGATLAAVSLLLAACGAATLPPLQTTIDPEQSAAVLAANGKRLAGATPLDVDRYQPLVRVAGCRRQGIPSGMPPARVVAGLDSALGYHRQKGGIGLAIWLDGKLIFEAYDKGANLATRTETFSMHKSLLALVVGAAIEDGVLPHKDVPVGNYLPEWANDPRGKIPLSSFLNMESGLELFPLGGPNSGKAMSLMMSGDITAVALGHGAVEAPHKTFRYNNANSQIVGTVLDRALRSAGHKGGYPAYLSEKIWCPLGNGDGALWFDREGGAPHYFAGMQASLRDWLRLGIMMANGGKANDKQLVPASWIAKMRTPAPNNPNYGLHLWLGAPADGKRAYSPESPMKVPHSEAYLADDVMFFDGFGGQRVYIVPSRKLVIARTSMVDFSYDDSVIINAVLRAAS